MKWRSMKTAKKTGETILVYFQQYGALTVRWCDSEGDPKSKYAHWHVDDYKHGPFPLRGYSEGDELGWMPRPKLNAGKEHE
jgi:hypothetical protein